jgi:hypothetical protein
MKSARSALLVILSFLVWASVVEAGEEPVISTKSKLTIGGRLHAQFHTTSVEDYTPSSTFFIRRARIQAEYEAGILNAIIMYDMGEGTPQLRDAFVNVGMSDGFMIRMGQFKKPFSLWELTSSTKSMVIERANSILGTTNRYSTNAVIIRDGRYADRDLGVEIHGKANKLAYAFGVFNGNGRNQNDDDNGKTFGGRVVVNVVKDGGIGFGVSNRMIDDFETISGADTTVADENFQAFEVDLDYGIKDKVDQAGPWVQAEFVYGKNPQFANTDTKFVGFMVAGSYNILLENSDKVNSIRPAFRVDWSKRNNDDDDTRTILLTPGMDIFFDKNNRLQVNVDVNVPNAEGADTEFAFRTQFQMLI